MRQMDVMRFSVRRLRGEIDRIEAPEAAFRQSSDRLSEGIIPMIFSHE